MSIPTIHANLRRVWQSGLAAACVVLPGRMAAFDLITDDDTPYVYTWDSGPIAMQLKLPAPAGPLIDGSASFNASVQAAMNSWNAIIGTVRFSPELRSAGSNVSGDGQSEIVMAATIEGDEFSENTLAVTLSFTRGDTRVESDIVFNSAYNFDSYRGAVRTGVQDIQRIALHELGHVLGLGHPDEAGQTVTAIMNSRVGAVDTLQADDTTGARTLYGAPSSVPPNDNFLNSIPVQLSGNTVTVTGTNIQATRETGEPNMVAGETGGRSVWWHWVAPTSGRLTVTTLGSNFDTMLAVYTGGTLAGLVSVASNDDVETPVQNPSPTRRRTSLVGFDVTGGTTYRITVDGWDARFGQISLNLGLAAAAGSPPTISVQPVAQTVTSGATVTMSVAASGDLLNYQWYRNGSAITGATTAELVLPGVQSGNAGAYHVVVSNFYGSVTSNTVTLTVNQLYVPPVTSSGGGGGGGGGAPSAWFLAALAVTGLVRWWQRRARG
jgi:hypothetical protein